MGLVSEVKILGIWPAQTKCKKNNRHLTIGICKKNPQH